jgi:hypothetical protein
VQAKFGGELLEPLSAVGCTTQDEEVIEHAVEGWRFDLGLQSGKAVDVPPRVRPDLRSGLRFVISDVHGSGECEPGWNGPLVDGIDDVSQLAGIPSSSRPPERTSTSAARSAMATGWCTPRLTTAVPSVIRRVAAARYASMVSGSVTTFQSVA